MTSDLADTTAFFLIEGLARESASPRRAVRVVARLGCLGEASGNRDVHKHKPPRSPAIIVDGVGGAIIAWWDFRNTTAATYSDIYAQRVQPDGQLGGSVVSVRGEAPLAFVLDPVRPNPSRGSALMVRFNLVSAAAAWLELLDVAGRRIAAREVGSLGTGSHSLDLGAGHRIAPGIYLVRLRQGASARMTRVAMLD